MSLTASNLFSLFTTLQTTFAQCVRLFLIFETALREPKRFIDETLRMFLGRAEEIVGRLDRSAADRVVLDGMARPTESAGPALGDGKTETKQIVLAQTDDAVLVSI